MSKGLGSYLFLTKDPDEVKKFNEKLSAEIIGKMGKAFKFLAEGDYDGCTDSVNKIIEESFPADSTVTIDDIVGKSSYADYLENLTQCTSLQPVATDENAVPVLNVIFPDVSESAGEKYDVLPAPYCYPAASENSLSSITFG